MAPFESPHVGLEAIAALWDRERDGPDERFTMASEIVCLEAPVAVVRVEVRYADAASQHYRDLWILRFGSDCRCEAFEEWPFWPGQPLTP